MHCLEGKSRPCGKSVGSLTESAVDPLGTQMTVGPQRLITVTFVDGPVEQPQLAHLRQRVEVEFVEGRPHETERGSPPTIEQPMHGRDVPATIDGDPGSRDRVRSSISPPPDPARSAITMDRPQDRPRVSRRDRPPPRRGCETEPDPRREGDSDDVVAGKGRKRQRTSSTAAITASISSSLL